MTTRTDSNNFRIRTITKSGLRILIRPIRPNDRSRLENFFKKLSPESLYFRFFMRIKAPSKDMLDKLLKVDYENDVVLVSVGKRQRRERILGIFRLVCCREGKEGEFSLLVGDPWQGQGVGARLFQYGLFLARARRLKAIWGFALSENKVMLHFAKKMGFLLHWDTDMMAYEMRMEL